MSELPYSYHTFLFPFIWKTNADVQLRDFERILKIGDRWIENNWEEIMKSRDITVEDEKLSWFQNYQAYQYFTTAANNAIFNADGKGVCRCYEYAGNHGKYIIVKGNETFELTINRIRLSVYDAGIGIIIFEMENHNYRDQDSVNKINEYGRRINFPYLMEGSHTLCADKITIEFDDIGIKLEEDYLYTAEHIKEHIQDPEHPISLYYVMKPIQDILDGGTNQITSNPKHLNSKFLIIPCTDDRMFVCCMVLDEKLSRELQGIGAERTSFLKDTDIRLKKVGGSVIDMSGNRHDDYMEGWSDEETLSSRLYKLLFIEKELSCQDNMMKYELLDNCVYRRWINMGTIYGVTHHSLIGVNNGNTGILYSVINPFLTLYVQMAVITLAQRSVLLMLENEAASISDSFRDDADITMDELREIERLQRRYVKIQNQLLLSEITVQEQGVELYDMLRRQLYIDRNMADLDSEMNNLRDITNTANAQLERKSDKIEEHRLNAIGLLMGALAFIEPFAMAVMLSGDQKHEGVLWASLSLVFFVLIWIYFFRHKSE